MKRIPRSDDELAAIDLFSAIGRTRSYRLGDPENLDEFAASLRAAALRAADSPIVVHGRRAEVMFGYVAASLGHASVIKQEDSGEIYASDPSIRAADYRVILGNGEEVLIEVKNFGRDVVAHPFTIRAKDLDALRSYATLFRRRLLLAVYWSRPKQWTLTDPHWLEAEGGKASMFFVDAIRLNEMQLLGDQKIGTTPPLVVRFLSDVAKPRSIAADGTCHFTIGGVEMSCAGTPITSRRERSIALYLALNGEWVESRTVRREGDALVAIEYSYSPEEQTPGQGFELVGALSTMIALNFNARTVDEANVTALMPAAEPGSLGLLIDRKYKGEALPLWRFVMQPAREAPPQLVSD